MKVEMRLMLESRYIVYVENLKCLIVSVIHTVGRLISHSPLFVSKAAWLYFAFCYIAIGQSHPV